MGYRKRRGRKRGKKGGYRSARISRGGMRL